MIQRLGASSLSFKAKEIASVRDDYNKKIDSNIKIAQKQNDVVSKGTTLNVANNQIAMQGSNGQKLDVVA